MANKFQKSILERLEQDSIRQKKVDREKKGVSMEPAEAVHLKKMESEPAVIEKKMKTETNEEPKEKGPSLDLSQYLIQDSRRNAKNKTFYLDVDVIKALRKVAKQQNVNDSKLVNDILRKVLQIS